MFSFNWMVNDITDFYVDFPLLQNTAVDEYVAAHTIGWWCKAIMIRNEPFLWSLSIAFEFAEVCMQIWITSHAKIEDFGIGWIF